MTPDERRLEQLQRAISLANTRTLWERNNLLVQMRNEGYQYKDLSFRLSRAAAAVGDKTMTPDAVEKAVSRHGGLVRRGRGPMAATA